MKNFIFMIIGSVFISMTGCNNSSTENSSSKVITEKQLFQVPTTSVNEKNIVVLSLENPFTTKPKNDISYRGSDCFTFTPTKDLNKTLLEIDDNIAVSHISVENLVTHDITEAYKNSEKVYIDFQKDRKYKCCIYHDDSERADHAVFISFHKAASNGTLLGDQDSINRLITNNSCTGISCKLDKADLTGMNLTDANLSGAWMHGTILAGANLSNADLNNTRMSNINFKNAIVDNVTINYAHFSYTDISGASFQRTKFPYHFNFSGHSCEGVDFESADLSNTEMGGVDFKDATLKDANLSGANIYATNFTNANLQGADLSHIIHPNSDTDFTNANLEDINLESIKTISRAKANLTGAKFTLFKWVEKKDITDAYHCVTPPWSYNPYPYPDQLYFCSLSKYGDLGMQFLTDGEYNKQNPGSHSKTCSEVYIIMQAHKDHPLKGYLCFSDSVDISVDWIGYKNSKDNAINQDVGSEYYYYNCRVDLDTDYCYTPDFFSFSFH